VAHEPAEVPKHTVPVIGEKAVGICHTRGSLCH